MNWDKTTAPGHPSIEGWPCPLCGEWFDPVILENRMEIFCRAKEGEECT